MEDHNEDSNHVIAILAILFLFNYDNGVAQELGTKVYWMVTVEVPIGKLAEYHAFNAKEMAPLMEQHGYNFVATWQTIVGDIEEVISVSEFESMAAYHKARVSLLGSEEWKTAGKKFDGMVRSTTTRFLSPAPYSKLK